MNVGSFFSGCGLLDLGLTLAGHEHAWFCEADPFRRDLLRRRWPGVPVHDDIRTAGAHNLRPVTGIVGGFPCKGASTAGKRTGFDHPETILWREMARAIGELRPRYVVVENVANILALKDGAVWGEVLGDLATLGFDVVWDCIPAAAFGAPHLRDRVIAIATDAGEGGRGPRERPLRTGESDSARSAPRTPADPDLGSVEPGRDGRQARESTQGAIADSTGPGGPGGRGRQREGSGQPGERRRDHAQPGAEATADAGRGGLRIESESERRRSGARVSPAPGEASPDARGGRQQEQSQLNGAAPGRGELVQSGHDSQRRGVRVEWGDYGAAIARWEAVHGLAPEPLVRRVDDRRAMRVERSRLSALGDGVQVQLGLMVGEYLMSLEDKPSRERW